VSRIHQQNEQKLTVSITGGISGNQKIPVMKVTVISIAEEFISIVLHTTFPGLDIDPPPVGVDRLRGVCNSFR
jgi:hypothetical protein